VHWSSLLSFMSMIFSSIRILKPNMGSQDMHKQQLLRHYHHQSPSPNDTVRLVLECKKRSKKDKIGIEEEPLWTMYCKGKKNGYDVRRETTNKCHISVIFNNKIQTLMNIYLYNNYNLTPNFLI